MPSDNALTLPAAKCFIYGGEIAFEPDFKNIGFWSGEKDYVVWKVRLEKAAKFDVYLDYACDGASSGNAFAIDGVEPALRGRIASTGGWDHYTLLQARHDHAAGRAPGGSPSGPMRP